MTKMRRKYQEKGNSKGQKTRMKVIKHFWPVVMGRNCENENLMPAALKLNLEVASTNCPIAVLRFDDS
jgi:hypothetical protein